MRVAYLDIPEALRFMESSSEGLPSEEALQRLKKHGRNVISEDTRPSLLRRVLPHLTNLFAILLWVAGALAYIASMPQLAYAIFGVVIINGVFSLIQEFKAEKATEALKNLLPRMTTVLREGRPERIAAEEIVPGDIVLLESGDAVPADARVIRSSSLLVNNSALTGESESVSRNGNRVEIEDTPILEMQNVIFMGTNVTNGNCSALVARTGQETEFGKIARLTQEVKEDLSPLQKQIAVVTRLVAYLSVAMGVVFFGLGVAAGHTYFENFMFAIGIIVANVPEGLLPTVTLSLAMGMQRMARRHALVKKLTAVETLGSTTVILTDKTGTLTQNRMTVTRLYFDGKVHDLDSLDGNEIPERLLDGMVLANNARLIASDRGGQDFVGDPTEAALLSAAVRLGKDIESSVRRFPRLAEIPFDSRRKRMTSVHRISGQNVALSKGAPGEIIARCSELSAGTEVLPLDDATRQSILAANDEMSGSGLRVLAFARRNLASPDVRDHDSVERDMAFVGLVGMFDPPRPEVSLAVKRAHGAGIGVTMVTGDYGLTAESIARRVGIIGHRRPRIITGTELAGMDNEAVARALRDNEDVIFARVSPEDKMKITRVLQDSGQIVAVTGDGVNDAPALKAADIGVAMGRAGTDVAKEAADLVLTDDNFASIVSAVEEGRTVYQNIRKFITYIFASNIPEVVPYILYVLLRIPLPLTVMQILAVDLGTDLLPALALGLEPPEPGIMERPPRSRRERLLDSRLLLRAYGFLGVLEAAVSMTGFFWFLNRSGWVLGQRLDVNSLVYRRATTVVFTGIVVSQVFNVFATRTDTTSVFTAGIFSNRWVWLGIVWELGLVAALHYVPVLQRVFGTVPLTAAEWGLLWLLAPWILVAEEVRKWLVRRSTGR